MLAAPPLKFLQVAGGKVTYHVEIDRKGMPDLDVVLNAEGGVIRETEEND